MNTTKEVKAYYEKVIVDRIAQALQVIENEGFSDHAYTTLRMLQGDLAEMNAVEHFFNAWHEEGSMRKGA